MISQEKGSEVNSKDRSKLILIMNEQMCTCVESVSAAHQRSALFLMSWVAVNATVTVVNILRMDACGTDDADA